MKGAWMAWKMRQRRPTQSWIVATGFSTLRSKLGRHSTSRPMTGGPTRVGSRKSISVREIQSSTMHGVRVTRVSITSPWKVTSYLSWDKFDDIWWSLIKSVMVVPSRRRRRDIEGLERVLQKWKRRER